MAMSTDETVRVAVLRDDCFAWTLTPEGRAALERAIQGRGIITTITGEPAETEPTMAIPRLVCEEARELARQRRDEQIDDAPSALIYGGASRSESRTPRATLGPAPLLPSVAS